MRVTLKKRLTKVEQALPSKAKAEVHKSQWLELFEEFGLPPDTPIPDEIPLGINFIKPEDRSIVSRMLPFNGRMLTAKQPENVSGD
jgi:hypothetical protein